MKTTASLYLCCWLTTMVEYRHMSDEDNSYTEFMQHIFSITTETEGRREGTQHGALPCLAAGEGWRPLEGWWFVLYCDGRAYRLPCRTEPSTMATWSIPEAVINLKSSWALCAAFFKIWTSVQSHSDQKYLPRPAVMHIGSYNAFLSYTHFACNSPLKYLSFKSFISNHVYAPCKLCTHSVYSASSGFCRIPQLH